MKKVNFIFSLISIVLLSEILFAQYEARPRVELALEPEEGDSLGVVLCNRVQKMFMNSKDFVLDKTSKVTLRIKINTKRNVYSSKNSTIFSAIFTVNDKESIELFFFNCLDVVDNKKINTAVEDIYFFALQLRSLFIEICRQGLKI
ncbi:MAG: hypothetical protein N3A61_05440 [Ignavibacteria bacterium]|nr:hypothetical protein [Ignavibacteria bacterium]